MALLNLPVELFEQVMNAFADDATLAEIFQARASCRTFAAALNHRLLDGTHLATYRLAQFAGRQPHSPGPMDFLAKHAETYLLNQLRHPQRCSKQSIWLSRLAEKLAPFTSDTPKPQVRESYLRDMIRACTSTPQTARNFLEGRAKPPSTVQAAAAVGNLKVLKHVLAQYKVSAYARTAYMDALQAASSTGKIGVIEYLLPRIHEWISILQHTCEHSVLDCMGGGLYCECEGIFHRVFWATEVAMQTDNVDVAKMLISTLSQGFPHIMRRFPPSFLHLAMKTSCQPLLEEQLMIGGHTSQTLRNSAEFIEGFRLVLERGDLSMTRFLLDRKLVNPQLMQPTHFDGEIAPPFSDSPLRPLDVARQANHQCLMLTLLKHVEVPGVSVLNAILAVGAYHYPGVQMYPAIWSLVENHKVAIDRDTLKQCDVLARQLPREIVGVRSSRGYQSVYKASIDAVETLLLICTKAKSTAELRETIGTRDCSSLLNVLARLKMGPVGTSHDSIYYNFEASARVAFDWLLKLGSVKAKLPPPLPSRTHASPKYAGAMAIIFE